MSGFWTMLVDVVLAMCAPIALIGGIFATLWFFRSWIMAMKELAVMWRNTKHGVTIFRDLYGNPNHLLFLPNMLTPIGLAARSRLIGHLKGLALSFLLGILVGIFFLMLRSRLNA